MRGNVKGSILVFILALIVLLSVLCMRLMQETVQELRHVSQFHKRDDLRVHAHSALNLAIGVLNEFTLIENTLYAPSQGWGDPLAYSELDALDPSIKWSISLIDESGKASLKSIKEKDLVSLFARMRTEGDSLVDEDDGQPFYDSLMDWQDADDNERDEGAEDDYYEDLEFPYFTPGKRIENFEELRMVKGFGYDDEIPDESGLFFGEDGRETIHMNNFRESFSFFHDGPVNINTASSFMIRFLCGDDENLYDDILDGPSSTSNEPFFKSMNDPELRQMRQKTSISTGLTSTVLRVLINVSKGKANFKLHAVLARTNVKSNNSKPSNNKKNLKPRSPQNMKMQLPFRVLALRENENLID
jgi:hypothetical protein